MGQPDRMPCPSILVLADEIWRLYDGCGTYFGGVVVSWHSTRLLVLRVQ